MRVILWAVLFLVAVGVAGCAEVYHTKEESAERVPSSPRQEESPKPRPSAHRELPSELVCTQRVSDLLVLILSEEVSSPMLSQDELAAELLEMIMPYLNTAAWFIYDTLRAIGDLLEWLENPLRLPLIARRSGGSG